MKLIKISCAPSFQSANLSYVINFINQHPYSFGRVKLEIHTVGKCDLHFGSNKKEDQILIPAQTYFFNDKYEYGDTIFLNTYTYKDKKVYSLENKANIETDCFNDGHFNFDVFETIFFHIARVEERMYPSELLTDAGLMPENELMIVKSGLQQQPIVDELLRAFFAVLNIEINSPKLTKIITHDIDLVAKYENSTNVLNSLGSTVKRSYSVSKIIKFIKDYVLSRLGFRGEPYFDLRLLSTKGDIEKIIYLYVGGNHQFDFPRSEKRNKYIKKWAIEAKSRGYSLGYHPSFNAATDKVLYQEELAQIEELVGQKIINSRQHYLHFDHKTTLGLLQSCGITTDSSFGLTRHIGFRAGTAFKYNLYDWERECKSDIIEIPIAWMDSAMWHWSEKQAKVFQLESLKFFISLSEGDICINIHNNSIYDFEMYGIDMINIMANFESNG